MTPEAQRGYAAYGLRSPTAALPAGDFTIRDLGGWARAKEEVFGKGAAYDRASAGK